MCARYTREVDADGIAEVFDLAEELDEEAEGAVFGPTWNAAPGTDQLIFAQPRQRSVVRRAARWGFRAPWAERALVNARAESVRSRPTFRDSFLHRRCVVPATGFYEWSSRRGKRVPSLFVVGDRQVFAMAGIWTPGDGEELDRFCVLTTEPNETVASIHDRMPVILPTSFVPRWLDPGSDPDGLRSLMIPFCGRMRRWQVSPKVNRTNIDGPELTEPWSDPQLSLF